MIDTQRYVGKIVMVERAVPSQQYSRSYDGEKLVLQATPNQLFTVSLSGYSSGMNAYGLYNSFGNRIELTGLGRYNVISVSDIPDWIFDELDRVEKEIEDVLSGRVKAQWVSSVYTGAKANLQKLREIQKARTTQAVAPAVEMSDYRWSYDMNFSGIARTQADALRIRAYFDATKRSLSRWLEDNIK